MSQGTMTQMESCGLLLLALAGLHGRVIADASLIYDLAGYQAGRYGFTPHQTYATTDSVSPLWQVTTWNNEATLSKGYFASSYPKEWIHQDDSPAGLGSGYGPALWSAEDLSLVYIHQIYDLVYNTDVQTYKGKDFLTFWAGKYLVPGRGSGRCYMLNHQYDVAYTVNAINIPEGADLHECLVTADGTMLLTILHDVSYDLTPVGGPPNGTVCESIVQEVDIETGNLVFEWRALDHYSITLSPTQYEPSPSKLGWDWFHVNSVQKLLNGNFLISSWSLGLLSYVNGSGGIVIWTMGSTVSQFTEPLNDGATNFKAHTIHFIDDDITQLMMFDNYAAEYQTVGVCKGNCSRGRHLEIDQKARTAKIMKEYFHPQRLQTFAQGSINILANGNILVGWGYNPAVTEQAPDGTIVFDAQLGVLPVGPDHYRIRKVDWKGYPTWGPAIAATGNGTAKSKVFFSWNGATEVTDWLLTVSDKPSGPWNTTDDSLKVARQGFETEIEVGDSDYYARAAALDHSGKTLGFTHIVEIKSGKLILA
ncbi:Arylsulfotransferase-domain-containing protein [Xylariaceae sp. FL0016]|nr:Arylsulfotransferase-domain-containing protein [Xylariaceae sp. FL0016]